MAAPLNQAWEWPVDGHTRPEDGTATNYSNTPGDITPTEHRKLQGKFSHPTTPALSLPGPLARPQSTPCIAEVAKKPVKLKTKLSNLLTSAHRTSSVDSHLTTHVTQMVGMNLLLLLPKEAVMNPDLFTGVERQDSRSRSSTSDEVNSEFVISTRGSNSTSTVTSSRDDSPFRTPSPLTQGSSPRRSREASPIFVPQKIHSVPNETSRRDSRIILFRPPSSRRSISRENAFDFDLEDKQPEINVTESPVIGQRRVRHTSALHRIHLTRSISESELLWIKGDQKMKRGDSADDVVSVSGRRKGRRGFLGFHSKPPSRELSDESIGEKEKKGLLGFLSIKGSRIKNQGKAPGSRGNLTIPIPSKVCEVGQPTCPTSATMPVDQATAAVKGYGIKKTESPTLAQKKKKLKLHNPKNVDTLVRDIYQRKYDILENDENEDRPLHAIVRSSRRDKLELMIALLVHSDFGCELIDLPAMYGNTALHLAVEKADIIAVKTLLAFGADINALNRYKQTPLDLLPETEQKSQLSTVLESLHAKPGSKVGKREKREVNRLPRLASYSVDYPELQEPHLSLSESLKLVDFEEGKSLISLAQKLEFNLNILYRQVELLDNPDTEYAIGIQQFELQRWRTTSSSPIQFEVQGGSRLLFLDGGGIKGLVQIEILARLEQMTGRRIVDLFDWIIGCSTGGIVALALVYAKKTLPELRQLYFKLKEQIFASPRFGFAYNTEALEFLLKETLGSELRMCDVKEPKILVAAVNKKTTKLELKFFNNCFDYPESPHRDQCSKDLVWKVARYTSAAPMYFSELDHYVDGGVMANNPCEYGLTAIQNYHRDIRKKLDIACVVSVGTGVYPEEGLGNTDAHKFLFFGKHWFNFEMLKKRATNLMTLLTTALLDSESVALNCMSRCKEQRIPFYRFSPTLETVIASGETDDQKLIEMLTRTKLEAVNKWDKQLDELVQLFCTVAEMSKKQRLLHLRHQRRARLL